MQGDFYPGGAAIEFVAEFIDGFAQEENVHEELHIFILAGQERGVFGGVGHYRKYHRLLTLSDNLGAFGVEHHECADDRVAENTSER